MMYFNTQFIKFIAFIKSSSLGSMFAPRPHAKPAKLEFTSHRSTSHVIAALILFNWLSTAGTQFRINKNPS